MCHQARIHWPSVVVNVLRNIRNVHGDEEGDTQGVNIDVATTPTPSCGPVENSTLGGDCSNAVCSTENSACVPQSGGGKTCICTNGYVRTGSSCSLGPTLISSSSSFDFAADLSNTAVEFGYILLDGLDGFTATIGSPSAVVHPDEGLLEITRSNSTAFGFKLSKQLSEAKVFVIQLTASSSDASNFNLQQIVTISLRSPTNAPEVFQIFLVQGTRKNTVIADLTKSTLAVEGYRFVINATDATSGALFDVTSTGSVICGRDIIVEDVANTDVVAKEYVFGVVAVKDGTSERVANLYVLIFKNVFRSTIEENWKGVIITYSLSSSAFQVSFTQLVDALTLSNNGKSISLDDGVDYDTMVEAGEVGADTIKFELELKTTDNKRQTSVSVELTVIDKNDNPPIMDKLVYEFSVLAGSYKDTVIGVVTSSDKDTVGTMSYNLAGTFKDDFRIDISGTLRSNRALEKKIYQARFSLTVSASDGIAASNKTSTININLISLEPSATNLNKSFSASVQENQNSGAPVTNVRVSNYTNYNFANPFAKTMFTLNPTTGIIVTARSLDREADPVSTDFTIYANIDSQDQCFPVILGQLHTTLEDVNDNSPRFDASSYTGSMKEHSPTGTLVTNLVDIEVHDDDNGRNADIYFTLNGTDSRYFEVEKKGNRFTIKASGIQIDGDIKKTVTLTLRARDDPADPSKTLSNTTDIVINIIDVNDHDPVFSPASYSKTITEETAAATLLTVTATDGDYEADNKRISYLLIEGDHGFYDIDESNGQLRTTQPIDREKYDQFTLVIRARDNGSPPRSASVTATITVTDVNDNAPVFIKLTHEPSVNENTCSSVIFTVSATDKDIGPNGVIGYNTTTPSFQVNPTSGEVSCSNPLDYEKEKEKKNHLVTIIASDQGSPSMSSTVIVSVTVNDVNDNTPQFYKSSYNTIISRGEWYSNKPILVVDVTDADSGRNADITLSLSTHTDIFTISGSTTGVVRILSTSSKPTGPTRYQFNIIATDGGSQRKSNQTAVIVDVSAVDNSAVRFNTSDFYFSMAENRDYSSTAIGTVTATYDPGVNVEYVFVDGGDFRIDRSTGVLTCTTPRDREAKASHTLIVRARETSASNSTDVAVVHISVTDENDNDPVFQQRKEQLLFNVLEDVGIGHVVVTIAAEDKDDGEKGRITFSIQSQTPLSQNLLTFTIDEKTGQIQVSRALDREQVDKYSLVIRATDHGIPQRTTTIDVTILISDVNDNKPIFSPDRYNLTVKENDKDALEVTSYFVTATDADAGRNYGSVTYEVISSTSCPLSVSDKDQTTGNVVFGKLHLRQALDYENQTVYQCVVFAKDMKDCTTDCTSRLTGTATVTVNVKDVNDQAPVFQGTPYMGNISRDAAIGKVVTTTIRATDDDSDYDGNGVVKFFIISDQSYFKIDIDSGTITVATPIDGIEGDNFTLRIEARDTPQEGESLTAQTEVNIFIISRTPRPFFNKTYVISLEEEADPMNTVEHVEAYVKRSRGEFKCSAINNCTYSIIESEVNHAFEIDADTGRLRQLVKFNREVTGSSFKLKVKVVDTLTNQFRTTSVRVDVKDINDNKPYFDNNTAKYQVFQSAPVNTVIAHITAIDKDLNSNPVYQILPGYDNTKIGLTSNGTLFVSERLGNETGIETELNVTDGDPIMPSNDAILDVNSRLRVTIEVRPEDYNEYAPQFTESEYQAKVAALSPRGTRIDVPGLSASDKDNDKIQYRIQSGNIRDILTVNNGTAEISLQFGLDDSIPSPLTVIVIAVDNARNPKTGTCTVQVTITSPKPTQCIAASEFDSLTSDSNQRTIFLGLFIALTVILTGVSVLAVVAIYKWRTGARMARYRDKITSQPNTAGKKDSAGLGYASLSQTATVDTDYNKIEGKDFSAGVRNPAYVSMEEREKAVCVPPAEPLPDYGEDPNTIQLEERPSVASSDHSDNSWRNRPSLPTGRL